jgi:hypothetical protein
MRQIAACRNLTPFRFNSGEADILQSSSIWTLHFRRKRLPVLDAAH